MKTVCAAVIRENGRILISNRPASKAAAGKWEFPGGKMEPGESIGACIRRELLEELDLKVIPLDVIFDFVHEYPGGAVHLIFIRCFREQGSEPRACESQQFRWVPVRELASAADFLEADIAVAKLLQDAAD